jgi:protein SCO1/2
MINGVADSVKQLGWTPGNEFRVLTLSIDPRELVVDASRKQDVILAELGAQGEFDRWPFLIGKEREIKTLATALGFSYSYDERTDQYAHGAVIFALTPDGRISRYLYGTEYAPRDVRLSLVEASEGKTGSFLDKILLTCFHYDPALKKYGFYIFGFLRIGAALIFIVVAGFVLRLWRRERRENA